MQFDSVVLGKPLSDLLGFMRCAIVENQMQLLVFWCVPLNLTQKSEKLFGSMFLGNSAHDLTGQNIKSCIQTSCAIALVIVSSALDLTGPERQHWLGSIKCLNLGFLVNAQHQSVFWRIHVQADNVRDLFSKLGIGTELEGFQPVRLESGGLSDLLDLPDRDTSFPGHKTKTPMSCSGRELGLGKPEHLLDFLV